MFSYRRFDPIQFNRTESNVTCDCYGIQPELRGFLARIDMYMRRLAQIVAVEVEPKWTNSQDSGQKRFSALFRGGVCWQIWGERIVDGVDVTRAGRR